MNTATLLLHKLYDRTIISQKSNGDRHLEKRFKFGIANSTFGRMFRFVLLVNFEIYWSFTKNRINSRNDTEY